MIWEIVATDECTRRCPFCYVKRSGFFCSVAQAEDFLDFVAHRVKPGDEVSVFGGEPLLNPAVVKTVVNGCVALGIRSVVVTNGDLIKENGRCLENASKTVVTAYDLFSDGAGKYAELFKSVPSREKTMAFTFDCSNIGKLQEFVGICRRLGVGEKANFSHFPGSWDGISEENLYRIVRHASDSALAGSFFNDVFDISEVPSFVARYVARIAEAAVDPASKSTPCSAVKTTWYDGRPIGHCIRCLYGHMPVADICNACMYSGICARTCQMDSVGGLLDPKVCATHRAVIESVVEFFAENSKNATVIRNLARFLK